MIINLQPVLSMARKNKSARCLCTVCACCGVDDFVKGFFPNLITNRALLCLVVVVPSFICFSAVMRFLQKYYVGVFTIRMEGTYVTLVQPDYGVMDVGQITKVTLNHSVDYKRADLLLVGTKDEDLLRLRSAAIWNGKSQAKEFATDDKAVAEMNAALKQQSAA